MSNSVTSYARLPEAPDPNIPQAKAADPQSDIWVSASAGSGKTKVLTDRVLRLLLPDPEGRWQGAEPHRILCITFTKAAAALMALRIQKKLGAWAVMPENKLVQELEDLCQHDVSPEFIQAARKLFAKILDTSGGLSIMTIHSFCQSTLGRFAIEAGVTPGFIVLDEGQSQKLLRQVVDDTIFSLSQGSHHSMAAVSQSIALYMDSDTLRDTLLSLLNKDEVIDRFIDENIQGDISVTSLSQVLLTHMGYDPTLSADDYDRQFITGAHIENFHAIARILATGSTKFQGNGQKIADWLALSAEDKIKNFSLLQNGFLTLDGKPRDVGAKLKAQYPDIEAMIGRAVISIQEFEDKKSALRQVRQTAELIIMVRHCIELYQRKKKHLNGLDFNDLIIKTRKVLETEAMDWVHFKLDEGIDHILVDEAQDTNGHQWKIIQQLSDEFLSGDGNTARRRSLFVVGDEKQSIFSFHGADVEAFQTMRDYFETRSREAKRDFRLIPLETSFRSSPVILQFVDEVFSDAQLAAKIGIPKDYKLTHYAYRKKTAGIIELWEIPPKDSDTKAETDRGWVLPVPVENEDISEPLTAQSVTSQSLPVRIANTIHGWIKTGEILHATGKPIEPKDILILVRTRTGFVPDLVRQLKLRGIPVSGVDRLKLASHIAVMDCLALARFVRYPQDDLSLACLLKSPLIRLSEDGLMALALGRSGSLWEEVQAKLSPSITQWLRGAIDLAKQKKPFDFFDSILNGFCPYQAEFSGWKAFTTCLGADCLDPLDEFLSFCLDAEQDGVYSLEAIIHQMRSNPLDIKREMEEEGTYNQVRIMTVHGSKGLEAPIVFLPDTTGLPSRQKIPSFVWGEGDAFPLWAAKTSEGCQQYKAMRETQYEEAIAEYMRLLYVALTRARDRLYIAGSIQTGEKASKNPPNWFECCNMAFLRQPYEEIEGGKRIDNLKTAEADKKGTDNLISPISANPIPLPVWVNKSVEQQNLPAKKIIQPSRLGNLEGQMQGFQDGEAVLSPLFEMDKHYGKTAEDIRFLRGNITHRLFEFLPDLAVATRQQAATDYMRKAAIKLAPAIQDNILEEVFRVLDDPIFAPVFGPLSQAEVPITGDLGHGTIINGQIDRLIIGHNKILIVDYKTNRPSPRVGEAIPEAYQNQMRAYKTAMSRLFPDHEIRCALLWTDQPLLMTVDV